MKQKESKLLALAKKRDYYYDAINKSWCKWTEYGNHAVEIYVDLEETVGWCLYGPEERHGFFSCLCWGFAESLDIAEHDAKMALQQYGGLNI